MRNMLKLASVWGTVLVLALFTWGVFAGIADPITSAKDYGLPIHDDAGALYFRVYQSRNFVVLLTAFIFLLRQNWIALATLMTVSITLPTFDALVLHRQLGADAPLGFHLITIGMLSVLSTLLWLRASAEERMERK